MQSSSAERDPQLAGDPSRPDGAPTRSRALLPLDLLRGFLIGMAELVPGISGGTVALVTGVYEQLIDSAAHLLGALRRFVTGPDRRTSGLAELRRTDWWLVVPVLVGMVLALFTMAGLMGGFVTDHPELARGLFGGLVAASVAVPIRMLPAQRELARVVELVLVAVAVVAAWVLVGFAGGREVSDPSPLLVFAVAAVAICALVVPGVSGSFFLLAVGLYATTLDAVHERDLGYIAVFMAGAAVGLASFVQLLRWLLHRHRRITLLVMIGLMIGSLRALWPWQSGGEDEPGAMVAPYDPIGAPLLLALLGVAVVVVLMVVESRAEARLRAAGHTG